MKANQLRENEATLVESLSLGYDKFDREDIDFCIMIKHFNKFMTTISLSRQFVIVPELRIAFFRQALWTQSYLISKASMLYPEWLQANVDKFLAFNSNYEEELRGYGYINAYKKIMMQIPNFNPSLFDRGLHAGAAIADLAGSIIALPGGDYFRGKANEVRLKNIHAYYHVKFVDLQRNNLYVMGKNVELFNRAKLLADGIEEGSTQNDNRRLALITGAEAGESSANSVQIQGDDERELDACIEDYCSLINTLKKPKIDLTQADSPEPEDQTITKAQHN